MHYFLSSRSPYPDRLLYLMTCFTHNRLPISVLIDSHPSPSFIPHLHTSPSSYSTFDTHPSTPHDLLLTLFHIPPPPFTLILTPPSILTPPHLTIYFLPSSTHNPPPLTLFHSSPFTRTLHTPLSTPHPPPHLNPATRIVRNVLQSVVCLDVPAMCT